MTTHEKLDDDTPSYRELLEEYLRRRNDSQFDTRWNEFDEKVKEALR